MKDIDRSAVMRTKKLPELMAGDIRKRILKGDLEVGGALPPEAELMQQYNVSRPTLRESLRILEADQLITIRRGGNGGALINQPQLDTTAKHFSFLLQNRGASIEDVYQARMQIEPLAMGDLARSATKAQIAEIKIKVEAAEQLVGSAASYAHAITDIREYMIGLAGNITVALLARLLDEILERHTAHMGQERGTQWIKLQKKSQRSLRKLVSLIEKKDASGAEAFWRVHLKEAAVYLLDENDKTTIFDLFE